MKKIKVFMIAIFVFICTMNSPRSANAALAGAFNPITPAGAGLLIGGIATFFAGGYIFDDARENRRGVVAFLEGTAGILLMLVGAVAGPQETEEAREQMGNYDVHEDLLYKVKLNILTADQSQQIENETRELFKKHESQALFVSFKGLTSNKRILQEVMEKTGVSRLTAAYLLKVMGIQVAYL